MRRVMRNYNEDDAMSKILLLYFAFQHAAIGVFFLFATLTALQFRALRGMADILPIDAWGVILIVSSVCFVLSVLFENMSQYYFMIVAGFTGMITFSLLAMANMELSVYQTNTVNYLIIASIDIIVAIIGGIALCLRKNT